MARLTLSRVLKSFGAVPVLHGIDLDIADGEFVVFVGPSGCGKSTLLRMIAGLEEANGGDIAIDGVSVTEVPAAKRGLAMVFQSYALYPHMSVRKNLSFGLETMGAPKDVIATRVEEAARILQIGPLLDRRPGQLSGGWRSAGRSCASRRCSCSTSPCRTLMPSSACRCAWGLTSCTGGSRPR